MGDFNHGNIKWDTLQSTGVEDQNILCLIQDNFLTQHVLEPTRATRVLDIVLSSQKEPVDNVKIKEPLGSSDHNQMHFDINIKSDRTKVSAATRAISATQATKACSATVATCTCSGRVLPSRNPAPATMQYHRGSSVRSKMSCCVITSTFFQPRQLAPRCSSSCPAPGQVGEFVYFF